MIQNPIICGFNPDPSIVRVGVDYYIVTSTFEWFPGMQIYHSRDLKNWELMWHVLTRRSQLDLRGYGDSAGPWAPSLSYHDGQFWLIYCVVRTRVGNFKDMQVSLVTAPTMAGPWSEPVILSGIGFDPSLFHDDDGRKWMVNIQWDFRKGQPRFAGIVIQEYDHHQKRLVGEPKTILKKPTLTEGPNLYKREGWYYLMLAEGGTGWNHGISMARSRSILGPYELDPQSAVLTTRDDEKWPLQKAGHGELVETAASEWYLVHLASRPLGEGDLRRCVLGRETCLQKVTWSEDGWLRLAQGGVHPALDVPEPMGVMSIGSSSVSQRDDFTSEELDVNWSSLRVPVEESWASLRERTGWLRVRGRESLHSLFEQSLLVRRLQMFRCEVETCLDFQPTHFTQMAGLICWYDTRTHYYLRVTHDEKLGRILGVILTDDTVYDELTDSQIVINDWSRIYLRACIDLEKIQFSASPDDQSWQPVGPILDMSKISDDYGNSLHFTGAMVGLCAQDLNGNHAIADFDYFEIKST